jgi:hypothetical protein
MVAVNKYTPGTHCLESGEKQYMSGCQPDMTGHVLIREYLLKCCGFGNHSLFPAHNFTSEDLCYACFTLVVVLTPLSPVRCRQSPTFNKRSSAQLHNTIPHLAFLQLRSPDTQSLEDWFKYRSSRCETVVQTTMATGQGCWCCPSLSSLSANWKAASRATSASTNSRLARIEAKDKVVLSKLHAFITDFIQREMKLDNLLKTNECHLSSLEPRLNNARMSVMTTERRIERKGRTPRSVLSTMDKKELRLESKRLVRLDRRLQLSRDEVKISKKLRRVFKENVRGLQELRRDCVEMREEVLLRAVQSRRDRDELLTVRRWESSMKDMIQTTDFSRNYARRGARRY